MQQVSTYLLFEEQFELPDGQGSCLGMLTEYVEDVSLSAHVYRSLQAQGDDDGFEVVKSLVSPSALSKLLITPQL